MNPILPPDPSAWHALPVAETLAALATDAQTGLAGPEAARRLARDGPNALPEPPRRSLARIFAQQFMSPLIYLLLAAAAIAFALGERGDAAVILAVLVFNAAIGSFQEGRAERSMAALRRLA
ncbi:MAG: haloacid dehalogenase, partial [Planctomycetes bacterium]|nr:haloacid dehalogenase [Planctomycetota bacterium]